jgi:hypothetical protein
MFTDSQFYDAGSVHPPTMTLVQVASKLYESGIVVSVGIGLHDGEIFTF